MRPSEIRNGRLARGLVLAVAAAALVAGSAAAADRRGDRADHRGNQGGGQQHAGWGQDYNGGAHQWQRGQRIGYNDWNSARPVDYRAHHLRQPPRGYEWRQSGSQYVLAAVATGVIASIILNGGR